MCGNGGTVTVQIDTMQYSAIYCAHGMALRADEVQVHSVIHICGELRTCTVIHFINIPNILDKTKILCVASLFL